VLRGRLEPGALLALFALGAAGGLIGDAGHVESGTTRYISHALPFVWKSQLWFPLLVGGATCALAVLRLLLAPPRASDRSGHGGDGLAEGAAAVAAVIGLYAVTALLRHAPLEPAISLCYALAALTAYRFADGRAALICGTAAAVVGPAVEIALSATDVSEYTKGVDGLFGVAPWLPALYFAFGVVAARLGELFAPREAAVADGG
jgi:hypothetical protein